MEIRELIERLESFGDNIAIIHQDKPVIYSSLLNDIRNYSDQLNRIGVQSGDVVALEGDFSPNTIAMLIAIWSVEAVAMPITMVPKDRHDRCLEICRCRWEYKAESSSSEIQRLNLKDTEEHELIKDLKRRNHSGLILFTSGTTAEPKAVLHDSTLFVEKFRRMRPPLRTLAFLMFDHMGGLDTLFYSLSSGGQLITLSPGERGAEEVAKAIERHKIELLPTSPTFLNFLIMSEVHTKYNLTSLKRISYGTETMPESTLRRLNPIFPDVTLAQSYGTSELGVPRVKSLDSRSTWIRIGGEGFETRVVDGQLEVRSGTAMMGYLNAPSPFDDEGWYATGDAVETDPTGEFYRILGRRSELINVGGEKVAPAEVESVLLGAENVVDVMVVSASNPILGKMVVARVVLRTPETLVELSHRLRAFCQGKLTNYQIPVKFEVVNQLERTSSGKKWRDKSRE
jgi:acyl-coenzyme A synthetase/AMP-(fatty) acid ligase